MTQQLQPVLVPTRDDDAVTRKPTAIIAEARAQAQALMNIVEEKKLFMVYNNKKHLLVEAWEIIGAFNRSRPMPDELSPILADGEVIGYRAHVSLMRDGLSDGAGFGTCLLKESVCLKKDRTLKENAHSACAAMAQTRAISRAYRGTYAWVAVLGGYEPTPAEEMEQEPTGSSKPMPRSPAPLRGPRPPAAEETHQAAAAAPSPATREISWNEFWGEVKRDSLGTPEQVHAALEVASMKDWLEKGHTLHKALDLLHLMSSGYSLSQALEQREAVAP